MKINVNATTLRMNNNLNRLDKSNRNVMEKLSSGLTINKAADDAAGLAISEKMRAQIRGLDRARYNTQDAITLLQTADSSLDSITNAMQRMRELSIRSMNDSFSEVDREALQAEFRQLQLSIDQTSEQSRWGSIPVIDPHQAQFSSLQGNQEFPLDKTVTILNGFNDQLEIVLDGVSHQITLPEGEYRPIDILIDKLDDILLELNPNLIANVNENRTISIQGEHSKSIDYIKGSGSFLFYDYVLGNPPGMIIGSTEYETEESVVHIRENISDTLSFYVGSNQHYTIKFPPGPHTREEALSYINEELTRLGATDVEAVKFGDERIALTSNKYVITGVGGNMIEIDDITSILFDNRKQGSISKSQAIISGRKDLTGEVKIEKDVNDQLDIFIQGQKVTVTFQEGTFTSNQIKDQINQAFQNENILATAEITYGRLTIKDDYFGSQSEIVIDDRSSAFDDLFVETNTIKYNPRIQPGQSAIFKGNYGLKEEINITENQTLKGKIGDTEFTLKLEKNTYSKDALIDALNQVAKDENLELDFSIDPTTVDGHHAIQVESTTSFEFDKDSDLYAALMNGYRELPPHVTKGATNTVYPPEGIAKPPEYTYEPAQAVGRTSIIDLTIDQSNNTLTFTHNGEEKTLTLFNGTYARGKEFLEKHQSLFENEGLRASINAQNRLVLETIEQGADQALESFGGTSHEYLMGGVKVEPPSTNKALARNASITNKLQLPNPLEITENNNKFSFTYHDGEKSYDIAFELSQDTNLIPGFTIPALNEALEGALKKKGLNEDELSFQIDQDNQTISLQTKGLGSNFKISNPNGTLYETLFTYKEVKFNRPLTVSNGYASERPTYIVSRESVLGKEFDIHPNINDALSLDFKHNNKKVTLNLQIEAGKHTDASLVSALNQALATELLKHGFSADLVKAQIGQVGAGTDFDESDKLVFAVNFQDNGENDSGSYVVDGVRGTAAYTFFYPAQGEPSPTFTIGSQDLSKGATIVAGENDTFTFDVDGEEKTIVLPEGNFDKERLLAEMNSALESANANIIASYYEGKLKLSSNEVGQITIDGIRGNARDTLFYETQTREEDAEWIFHTGANTNQNLEVDKVRVSSKLLRINSIMVDDYARAEKALGRLDAAINRVSSERAYLGANLNRLEHTSNQLGHSHENLLSSESLIRDTNMADAMMEKMKIDILLSSNQSIMAHAYQHSSEILKLLS